MENYYKQAVRVGGSYQINMVVIFIVNLTWFRNADRVSITHFWVSAMVFPKINNKNFDLLNELIY